MEHALLVTAAVAVLAVIQSVFGMGLLVFGTPTLLLMGLDFTQALGWLLPASVTISTLQIFSSPRRAGAVFPGERKLWFCLVPLVLALSAVVASDLHARLDLWIGATMIVAAAIRYDERLQAWLAETISQSERSYLVVMGVVHGLTNMGGALLAIYASSLYRDKHAVRETVATYYLTFGVAQILTIAALKPSALGVHGLIAALIAASIYWLCGNRVFERINAYVYERAFTGFIGAYGAAVIAKFCL